MRCEFLSLNEVKRTITAAAAVGVAANATSLKMSDV